MDVFGRYQEWKNQYFAIQIVNKKVIKHCFDLNDITYIITA